MARSNPSVFNGRGAYRGRFAPSPTGPLHFGSLVAAMGSYLDARAQGGEWLLRIDDVDQERSVPSAVDRILRTLEGFGFQWDGEVLRQSRHLDRYRAALVRLRSSGDAYPCTCSRREIACLSPSPAVDGGWIYPGTCRAGLVPSGRVAHAWRVRVPDHELSFNDRVQGPIRQNLERAVGDFVLRRADGQYAYQLAVVVDDAEQGVTAVVRGADLLDSTPRQIWLQQRLNLPTPSYAHLPVVLNRGGEKLSKQTHAPPVDASGGAEVLAAALTFLGHAVPSEVRFGTIANFWSWAFAAWAIERIPPQRGIRRSQRLPP